MAQITGIEIGKINKMYDEMFKKQNRVGVSTPSIPAGGGDSGGGSQTFPASGGAAIPTAPPEFGEGSMLTRSTANQNLITVNVGAALASGTDIEEAVAKALQEGARRGINVAF